VLVLSTTRFPAARRTKAADEVGLLDLESVGLAQPTRAWAALTNDPGRMRENTLTDEPPRTGLPVG